jgi:hypothetical protein
MFLFTVTFRHHQNENFNFKILKITKLNNKNITELNNFNIHLTKLRLRVGSVGEQRLESAPDLRELSPEGGRL